MLRTVRISLASLIAWGLTAGGAQAQTVQKGVASPSASGGAQVGAAGSATPGANEVLATVTNRDQTHNITRGEVINFLARYPLPAQEDREATYQGAVEVLSNTALLNQFLARQNIQVTPARIDEDIERMKQQLKTEGQDLASMLLQSGTSLEEIRKNQENRIRWSEYVKHNATEAVLRKFLSDNRDLFSGTQIRASHILLKVDPNASATEKEKVRQKLLAIRNDIVQNKITFGEAANKYSEDQANAGGAGGDLDYFTLQSGFVEEFANAAFKLRKGDISQPVETPFGFHLIQITDRREGKLPDFDQNKTYILQAYATDLQKNVLAAEKKTAKIDVKPMPKDLFPQEPAATSTDKGGATATSKSGATPPPKP
jgi:parvulin-like peptidyl-prolyl isomerase